MIVEEAIATVVMIETTEETLEVIAKKIDPQKEDEIVILIESVAAMIEETEVTEIEKERKETVTAFEIVVIVPEIVKHTIRLFPVRAVAFSKSEKHIQIDHTCSF